MHFNLKIHAKKNKNAFSILKFIQKNQEWKKESTFIWILFTFISPVHFFAFQPKKSYKKDKNAKKGYNFFLQIRKIHMYAKKVENNISKKKDAKKQR